MKLYGKGLLLAHGVHQAVEAVDHHDAPALLFDTPVDAVDELAGREFSRIHLFQVYKAVVKIRIQIHTKAAAAHAKRLSRLVEGKNRASFVPLGGLQNKQGEIEQK